MSETTMARSAESTIGYDLGDDGVVVLTLDDPNHSANTMNADYVRSMGEVVNELERELSDRPDAIAGVIITSAKKTLFAGGDLHSMLQATQDDAPTLFAEIETVKDQLRRLETLGRPVVAAINGSALGGGLEIALACHHRIAVDVPGIEIGLPEVTLGLLPGAGGVTRTVRMLGIQDALTQVLLQGPRMKPSRALDAGLVDELVGSADELLPAARARIAAAAAEPEAAAQPWDRPGYRVPGGTPSSPKLASLLPAFPAHLRKQLKGAAYRAPRHILATAVEGAQVDFETATRIESRYLVDLVTGQQFKNMAQAFFFDLQHINSGGSRPSGVPAWQATRMVVLGAGMMGAGIAYASARAGIGVVLKDVTLEAAEKGKAHAAKLLDRQVETGRLSPQRRDDILARITASADPADAAGCDVVVEAVFESRQLKHQVFQEIEPLLAPDALLCSNTSTLPITGLATGVQRPADFIGLHFSPVDKMPLVEIIKGEQTADATLAKAHDLVRQIRKTPIVVNDARGFFTSRVFGTLVLEAAAMVGEGVSPVTVERAATQAGFPAPPLAMIDEVTLTLSQKIRDEARDAAESAGVEPDEHPGMAVIDRMVDVFGRSGKATGAGFYDYAEGSEKRLWPGLFDHFGQRHDHPRTDTAFVDLQERFTFIMSLETVRCLDEGVLTAVPDANVGSILGIGFPALHGGALQYVDAYDDGVAGFVARCRELAARYGARFEPPALLVRRAEQGERFRM